MTFGLQIELISVVFSSELICLTLFDFINLGGEIFLLFSSWTTLQTLLETLKNTFAMKRVKIVYVTARASDSENLSLSLKKNHPSHEDGLCYLCRNLK